MQDGESVVTQGPVSRVMGHHWRFFICKKLWASGKGSASLPDRAEDEGSGVAADGRDGYPQERSMSIAFPMDAKVRFTQERLSILTPRDRQGLAGRIGVTQTDSNSRSQTYGSFSDGWRQARASPVSRRPEPP